MINIEQAKQQAHDLLASGSPDRAIVVMTTPFKLAILNTHLSIYRYMVDGAENVEGTLDILHEIQEDVQKVIIQILQQEFPSS